MNTLEHYLNSRTNDTSPPLLATDTVLDRWKIRALLARGGSGEVYRAEDTADKSTVAIKVLFRTDAASRQRFLREIEVFTSFQSTAFPRIFDHGEINGYPWYAMELLEPCELPRTDRTIANFLLSICEGVSKLHCRGFVHRDIKPDNIMRRTDGTYVLIDLGLVKTSTPPFVLKDDPLSIVDGRVVGLGTVGYAAPEQLIGGNISTASDIHALGVLANTCFHDNPPPIWKRIILRATSSIPGYRYRTIEEFIRAIHRRHTFRCVVTSATIAAMLTLSAVGVIALFGLPVSSPLELQGNTRVINRPIRLKKGETFHVIGPGRLEADISGEHGSLLSLTNCVVINHTTVPFDKSGIRYELLNNVYLNFSNLAESPGFIRRINSYDGKFNEVRFKGPHTIEELHRLKREENIRALTNW